MAGKTPERDAASSRRLTELAELAGALLDEAGAPVTPSRDADLAQPKAVATCGQLSAFGETTAGIPATIRRIRCGSWSHLRCARWRAARWAPVVAGFSSEECLDIAADGAFAIALVGDFPAIGRNRNTPITAKRGKVPKVLVGAVPVEVASAARIRAQLRARSKSIGVHERLVIETRDATYLVIPRELLPRAGGRPARVDLSGLVELGAELAAWWVYFVLCSGAVRKARGEGCWAEPRRTADIHIEGKRAAALVAEAEPIVRVSCIEQLAAGPWAAVVPMRERWEQALAAREATWRAEVRAVVRWQLQRQPTIEELRKAVAKRLDDLTGGRWADYRLTLDNLVRTALDELGAVESDEETWRLPDAPAIVTARVCSACEAVVPAGGIHLCDMGGSPR